MGTHFKIHSSYTFPPTNNDIPTLQSPTLRKKGVHYNNHIDLKTNIALTTKPQILHLASILVSLH